MNLPFSTHIDGKPTCFIDKIWAGIWQQFNDDHENDYSTWFQKYYDRFDCEIWDYAIAENDNLIEPIPKIHTIREDKKDRWKVGTNIHFVINNRSKDRFQFAPIIPVKSTQFIKIKYEDNLPFPWIVIGNLINWVEFDPNNHFDYITQATELAHNDGFNSLDDFLKYFNKDFTGKIIHWTDYKY